MFKFTPIKTKQQKDQELEKTIQQPEKVVEKTSRMFDFTPIEVKKEEIVEQPKIKPVIPSLIPEKQPEVTDLLFKKIETPEKSITETTKEAVPETKEVIVPEKTHPIYSFFDKMLEATTEGLNKSLERLQDIPTPKNERFEWLVKPIESIVTSAFKTGATSIPETLLDTTKRLKAFEEIQKTGVTTDEETGEQKYATTADKIGKGIEVGVGAANTAFIPITSIFSAAKEVPGLNIPVKAIEWVFGKAGELGTLGGDKVLNALPISDEDKQSLALPVAELTGLVGMIVLGGSLFKGVSKGVEVAKNKITESKPGTPEYNDAVKEILDTENTDALMDKTIDKLETEIKAVKEKGEDITPEKAKEIVEKVNEEVLLKPETKQVAKIKEEIKSEKESLETEAKKYKSAEDFIRGQGKLVYHGGTEIYEVGNIRSKWGAFYMSDNPTYAKSYGGKNSVLNEMVIKPEAKLADLRKPSNDLVFKIEEIISPKKTGKTLKIQKPDGSFVEIPETKGGLSNPVHSSADIIQGIKNGKAYYAEMPEVKEALKKLGYDGMITQESKFGSNYGVWNKDVIKTKSQLIDIWNEAQKTKEEVKQVEKKSKVGTKKNIQKVYRGETTKGTIRRKDNIIKGKTEFGDAPFVSFADNAKLAQRFGQKVDEHFIDKSKILDLENSSDKKALSIVDNEIDLSKEQVKELKKLGYDGISFNNLEPGYKGKEIRYFGDFNIKEHPVIKETKKAQVKPKEIEVKPEKEVVSEKDRIDALIEKEKSLTENMDKYQKEKALKGIGMEYAGYKRAIEGKPTQIEKSKARSYLESNHKGKEVEVAGKQGTLTGKVAFGSHEIQFKDGIKKFVKGENIRSEHITDKMVLDYIKDEALKKIKGKEDLYGIKPEKEVKKPEVKIEEKPEIKKPESKKVIEKPEVKKKKIEEVKKPETKEEKEKKKFQSRVYERMQAEYADILKDDLTYERMNLKKDAEKAVKLIEKDKQEAYEVATGMKEPPEGQTSTAVNIALTEKALEEGNNSLASTLIKNRSLAQTRRGQEIVAEKGSISDNSVSRYVKELINARMETLKTYTFDIKTLKRKTKKQQVIEKIDMETQKAQKKIKNKELDLEEAQKLIDSIICK